MNSNRTLPVLLYNASLLVGSVVGLPLALPLLLNSPKRRRTFLQRMGLKDLPAECSRPASGGLPCKPVWVHALSVGEVLSAVPLVAALRADTSETGLLFSASTLTGFQLARSRVAGRARGACYFPYDFPFAVRRLARRVDPQLFVMVETDIWPNFLGEMQRRRVPVIMVNARLSERSFKGYRRARWIMRRIWPVFSAVCAQSAADADRFRRLGVPADRICVTGNVKFDVPADPLPPASVERLRSHLAIGPRQKVLVAGSTHPGEEALIAEACARIKSRGIDLRVVAAPRDPARAAEVKRIFRSAGFSACRMTPEGSRPTGPGCEVTVVDTIGLLAQLYALADAAFVGGSLVPCGGHNPLEPAVRAKPVLFGPHMHDFREIARLLLEGGGATQTLNVEDLAEILVRLMGDGALARAMGRRSAAVCRSQRGAVDKTLTVIKSYLHPQRLDTPSPGSVTRGSGTSDSL